MDGVFPSTIPVVKLDQAVTQLPFSVARQKSRGNSAVRKMRGWKSEHRAARSQIGGSVLVVFTHFFHLFLYNIYVYWARLKIYSLHATQTGNN